MEEHSKYSGLLTKCLGSHSHEIKTKEAMKLPVLIMMNAQGDFRKEGWLKKKSREELKCKLKKFCIQ